MYNIIFIYLRCEFAIQNTKTKKKLYGYGFYGHLQF